MQAIVQAGSSESREASRYLRGARAHGQVVITGYLLKDRIADVGTFTDAVRRVAAGGSALDPEVVGLLLGRRRREDPLAVLTPRERDVLGLMAEGRSNAAMAAALVVTERAVKKHVTGISSGSICRRRRTIAACWPCSRSCTPARSTRALAGAR